MFFKKYGVLVFLGGLIFFGFVVDYINRSNQRAFAWSHNIQEADDWPSTTTALGRRLESLKFLVEFKVYFTDFDWQARMKKWQGLTKYGVDKLPSTAEKILTEIEAFKLEHEEQRRNLSLELTGYVDSDWDELLDKVATLYEEDAKEAGLTIEASRLEIESARRKRAARRLGLPEDVDSITIIAAHRCLFEFLKTLEDKPRVPMTGGAVERVMAHYNPIIEHPRLDEILETRSFPKELALLFGKKDIEDFEHLRRELELEDMPWTKFLEHLSQELERIFG